MASTFVDSSLWWDPFASILSDLENVSLSSDLHPNLVKKLKENHAWFVDTMSLFKPPNQKSKEALNSQKVKIGSHELNIQPELKEKALQISLYLNLDEVQSYILLERSLESSHAAASSFVQEFVHVTLLQYYIERQCLLKCTRRILMHALYLGTSLKEGSAVMQEALKLISDGLESKLISVLEDLLSSTPPEQMDVDLFTLWAEETLIEDNLVLDILFLIYYESFRTCSGERWKKLCALYKGILSGSSNFEKLAVSSEAQSSCCHAKIQLLLILIETLDLESLLQMVHDEIPFRRGTFNFSMSDIQEMDALISSYDVFQMKEAGSLILAWAVFLCLISSLPGKEENYVLMEIDHVAYVRQAFEAASLSYFQEILQSDILKESDGPSAGYRSVLRTFISAFIASYEINLQMEDNTLNLILDILCKIYRGEESLCTQFWDRESFIDGPIRCLLYNLECEFPLRIIELICLLSSLCEGSWPTECTYNFLDKSVGISTLFEVTNDSLLNNISEIVETRLALHVPGVEGLLIPSRTRGHVLKIVGGSTALVRWEYAQSAVLVLLHRLSMGVYSDDKREVLAILDLLARMVSFSKAVCFALLDIGNSLHVHETAITSQVESTAWVVEIIGSLFRNLSPNPSGAALLSMGVDILAKMLRCCPSHVVAVALKANLFNMTTTMSLHNVSSSESWLLFGKLAKMLLIDCEKNDYDRLLVISVLDFTLQLVETGVENDFVVALVVFSLQYILVSHEYWKYKEKYARWRVTLKVLEVMKVLIMSSSYSEKLGEVVRDILLNDSSIHGTLFRIVCTTTQTLEKLYVSRLFELKEIEGWQLAIASVLDIFNIMLSKFSKDISSSLPVFHQAVLSSTTKPIPVIAAVASLMSYSKDPAIQVGAAKVLSALLTVADFSLPYLSSNMCFGLDDKQISELGDSICCILLEQPLLNEDLFVAIVNVLNSAACYQPAFLVSIFATKDDTDVQLTNSKDVKRSTSEASLGPHRTKISSLVEGLLQFVGRSEDLINSNACLLLSMLNFLKALWQGAGQYANILELLKSSEKFWKQLSNCIVKTDNTRISPCESMTEAEWANLPYKYQCQSAILEILAYDMFLDKKLLFGESHVKESIEPKERIETAVSSAKSKAVNPVDPKDIFSDWCDSSVLSGLIKLYVSCEYDNGIHYSVQVAISLLTVHLIGKLETTNAGCLSVSLLQKIHLVSKELSSQPAFSELLAQYSKYGYSEGKELKTLILNDLYYHIQGELQGRKIGSGPFKELSQFLAESKPFQKYEQKYDGDLARAMDARLFDTEHIRADLGLDVWDYSHWKASKATGETMLHYMQNANSMVLLSRSKLSALKSLLTVLIIYEDDSLEKRTAIGRRIPDQVLFSCIDNICRSFHAVMESLAPLLYASEDVLDFLAAQTELLLHLMRSAKGSLSAPVCTLVLRTLSYGLKVLSAFKPSVTGVKKTKKLILMSVLLAVRFGSLNSGLNAVADMGSLDGTPEISNVCLGLLPIISDFISTSEYSTISLTAADIILRRFLTPNTWFPIIQQHLKLQHVILKLQDKNSVASIPILLKFFLTIAHVRGGAEMLLNAGFLSSLRVLFADLSDGRDTSVINNEKNPLDKTEKPQHIWGLGLAVVTAIIHSLGDTSVCAEIVEKVIVFFFSEKAHLISYYLTAPDFPSNDHDKKRQRIQRRQTSLSSLKETENTLMLMCVLAKHWRSWVKAMKDMDSPLREISIHLLAFISRGTQRYAESSHKTAPLLSPPVTKEEVDCCMEPLFVNSRNGWFALSCPGCAAQPRSSSESSTTALTVKDPVTEVSATQTYFSDSVALQIYKIAFLLLKFLCLQAEGAAKRAEDVGFVDLAHFPELPMPEILHGLQDQAIAIVTELCEGKKLKQISHRVQYVCILLLQMMEMALYLELCVLQICGIRPVLGRVEDFSKEAKLLIKATEGHAFLKSSVRSLKQVMSLVYPGLLLEKELL